MSLRLPVILAGARPIGGSPWQEAAQRRGGAPQLSVRHHPRTGCLNPRHRRPRATGNDQQGDAADSVPLPSDGASATSKAAILAKLEAAKKYKEAMGGSFQLQSSAMQAAEPPQADAEPSIASNDIDVQSPTAEKFQQAPEVSGSSDPVDDGAQELPTTETSDVVAKFLATGEEDRARVESSLLSALQDATEASASASAAGSDLTEEQKLYRARAQQADVKPTQFDSAALYAQERARAASASEVVGDPAASSDEAIKAGEEARAGSSQQAAQFLGATLEQQKQRAEGKAASMTEGQRMEDFLLQKEQKMKEQEVEFISVEKNYKPKVSTWGMFPRPENISKTYGGGKTLRPEDLVETEEERKKREQAVRDRVKAYKMKQGLLIDDSTNEACLELFEKGMASMRNGRLAEAAELFYEVEEKVVLKSEWGGRSRLQRALCLDSLGRTEEAGQIYKLIRNHPQADVAKRAKQMMFGIESMDFLKTHTISYGVGKDDYAGYFRRISSDWDNIYLSTSEEDEANMRWQSAVALAVMATPILTIAGVVLSK